MLPALGQCEDLACLQSPNDSVRLFRCSIHCDRNLCLYHLNAHNVYYEEEKKQNDIIICELENNLSLYQRIFEQQIISYRDLVRQASTILLHNTSALVPIDQVRPVLEKLQQAIANYQEEKIIIKCEPTLDTSEIENEKTRFGSISVEPGQKVVVRIPRIDCNINNSQSENENPLNHIENGMKSNDKVQEDVTSPAYLAKKLSDGMKKRTSSIKRLQK